MNSDVAGIFHSMDFYKLILVDNEAKEVMLKSSIIKTATTGATCLCIMESSLENLHCFYDKRLAYRDLRHLEHSIK